MKNLKFLFILSLLFSCTPDKNAHDNDRRYSISISHEEEIFRFSFEDNNDTLRLFLPVAKPKTLYIILVDDETKTKIMDVMRYHFDLDNVKAGKDDNKGGSVTFEISSSEDIYIPHDTGTMTAVCKGIYKNTDVSAAYSELIVYMKGKYPEFKSWPD